METDPSLAVLAGLGKQIGLEAGKHFVSSKLGQGIPPGSAPLAQLETTMIKLGRFEKMRC